MKSKRVTIWVICIVLLILSVSQVHAFVTIDADHPDIQYVGRVNFDDAKAPILYWPGTEIIANFEGTSINVKLHDYGDNYFYIIIDDGVPTLIDLTPGARTYAAASGLADSVHKIQVFKRTETQIPTHTQEGEVGFTGFELEDGKSLVAPPERPQRRIEYYGDSITSGTSVAYDGETSAAFGKDNYYTYAAITARNFNAEYHCISVSGIGLYLDPWGFGGNMQTLYYNKQSKTTYWDFNKWTPHIVVINLGQNDKVGSYTQAGAEQNYINFTQTIRSNYPNAHIILALGSMDATRAGSPWPGYLQNAVSELNTTYGDSKVYSLIFPYSGGAHPDVARHAVMATQLTDFIDTSIPDPWLGNVDINSDSIVDNGDFAVLASNWQQTGCDLCNGADLTGDGNVNFDDLLIVANNWLGDYADHSLMGYWEMNGDALDSSYYANDGIVHGSPVWEPSQHSGGSMVFDGIDDYIDIEGYKGVTGRQSRTVSAWIKTSSVSGVIVSWGNSSYNGSKWIVRVSSTGTLRAEVGGGYISGTTDLTANDQWHHIGVEMNNDGTPEI
ncbi:MAG: hypothetical protein K9M75_02365 [Phycisphaerae bacterium]|nr:hypothetical protein [Phycisphaerae bacterium]